MGCKKRISSGLDWVFNQVERAIILEDDCKPAESFFRFCDELLELYKDDEHNDFRDEQSVQKNLQKQAIILQSIFIFGAGQHGHVHGKTT